MAKGKRKQFIVKRAQWAGLQRIMSIQDLVSSEALPVPFDSAGRKSTHDVLDEGVY